MTLTVRSPPLRQPSSNAGSTRHDSSIATGVPQPDIELPTARLSFTVRGFHPAKYGRAWLMNVDIDAVGRVEAVPGDGGVVPLDGISFRP
jgi:hypothetical protein